MLTNYDLEDLCHHFNVPLVGIYMKDQLPSRIIDGNYIINLESSEDGKNKGTHWTTLVIQSPNAMFYDSYGATPSLEIREFVKRNGKGIHLGFNNWVIQDIHSENCGYFCLDFLRNIIPTRLFESANAYINQFQDDTRTNDDILRHNFKGERNQPKLIKRLLKQR